MPATRGYVESKLIDFALENKSIESLTRGVDPEEGFPVYYLRVKGHYNFELGDKITDLELNLYKDTKENIFLGQWPANGSYEPFLGESIWNRNSSKKV